MQKFGWKRKREVVPRPANALFPDPSDDQSDHIEEGMDWLAPAKKPKALVLEDAAIKSERLKKEGVILAESSKWWSAIRRWSAATALQPHDHTLQEMIAQAYMQVGEYVPSIKCGEQAVQAAPLWWCGHQTLGRALMGVGELHRAVMCFSRSLRLHPDNSELRDQDLKWASQLLETYRELQKKKKPSSEDSKSSAGEESLAIVDLKDHPEGFNDPTSTTASSSSTYPEPVAGSFSSRMTAAAGGRSSFNPRPESRFSVSESARFVSCCSSNKSGRVAEEEDSEGSSRHVDLSKMVCMRPNLNDR